MRRQPVRAETWFKRALAAAGRDLHTEEDHDWQVRNWCELLAVARAIQDATAEEALWSEIARVGTIRCSPRFAERMNTLAGGRADGASGIVAAVGVTPCHRRFSVEEAQAVKALVAFGDVLFAGASDWSGASDAGDALPRAFDHTDAESIIAEARGLRAEGRIKFRAIDASSQSAGLWRRWFRVPCGDERAVNLLLTPREELPRQKALIWTGVHDATHLVHMTLLAGPAPSPLEFNSGLLVAEAVAMAAEISAAVRARSVGQPGVVRQLWSGLAERISRVTWFDPEVVSVADSPTARHALRSEPGEFASLPTLAGAYVLTPLALAARNFRHPLVPPALRAALTREWMWCREQEPLISDLLSAGARLDLETT